MFLLIASPPAALTVPAALLADEEVGILHFKPVYAPHEPAIATDLVYLLRPNPRPSACCGGRPSRPPGFAPCTRRPGLILYSTATLF